MEPIINNVIPGIGAGLAGFGIAPFSISLALGLTMLELLVAVIQAYVFALLTAVFIGMAIHVDH